MSRGYREWREIQDQIAANPELAAEYAVLREVQVQQTMSLKRGKHLIDMLGESQLEVRAAFGVARKSLGMRLPHPNPF